MKTTPIVAASIVSDGDGTPRSTRYDDIYHPRSGALAQARHVFLDGDALAARWRGRNRFVVLETGFGLGNNFLATWAAWRADPRRCRQLHFVSIEESPPSQATLASLERERVLAPLVDELVGNWPPLTCNLHRIVLESGGVELLLAFGAVAAWLPQLVAEVDAFFLDGFAPARNPEMWDARLFKAMARLASPGATVATWSAARTVRDGLRSAGFDVAKAPGSGGKRDITRARFAPEFTARPSPRRSRPAMARAAHEVAAAERVIIVGAGLAGCALASALAERGMPSLVLEQSATVAGEASGNPAGLFHAVVHGDDGRHARFHRSAAFAAAAAVGTAIERNGIGASVGGLLRLETRLGLAQMMALLDSQGLPADFVEALDAAAASRLAGVRITGPAWHYPRGGWADPRALARSWLADASAELRLGCAVASLRRVDDAWQVCDVSGATIASGATVALCNGSGSLHGISPWPIRRQRGQLGALVADDIAQVALPRLPIAGAGYVLPPIDGALWFGASSAWNDDEPCLRREDHERNLDRLGELLGLAAPPEAARLEGRVGFRWTSDDRLPVIGAVPADLAAVLAEGCPRTPSPRSDQPRFIARASGLFVIAGLGSRGIASAALGSQLLAAAITGAPLPAEADLLDAVDPARFLSRDFRRGEAARQRASTGSGQPPVGPIAGSAGA